MEKILVVRNLRKSSKSRVKTRGLKGALKNLFAPQYTRINFVNEISFEITRGELLGFIGPNGASKSSSIKHPSGT